MAERGNELIVIGQGRDDFGRRKRNVNEETDFVAVTTIAQRFRQRNKMVVVHPNHVVGLQQCFEMTGEILVYPEIAAEIASREFGEIEPIMQDRP